MVPLVSGSFEADAYRRLRVTLQFSPRVENLSSLVITSPAPGDGKTTTAINLAIAFAKAGNKVLLVDGDLRKPSIGGILALRNTAGLSNLIIGEESLENSVQTCDVDNLFVLTSGPIPPNPAEILSSKKSRLLFKHFEQEYEITIIDSPPVITASDAAVLSTLSSGTLLVVRYGKAAKSLVADVVNQLKNVKANLLGVVINHVPVKSQGYQHYHLIR